jgi:hypothetical protein
MPKARERLGNGFAEEAGDMVFVAAVLDQSMMCLASGYMRNSPHRCSRDWRDTQESD